MNGLLTDLYELTMAAGYFECGKAGEKATFEFRLGCRKFSYTRMTGGMLMASGDESVTLSAAPCAVPAPVHMLVPGWGTTPERPGSMVKVTLEGAMPLDC